MVAYSTAFVVANRIIKILAIAKFHRIMDESQSNAKIFKTTSEGERVFARSEAPK
jgi:hypothetical protein